MVNRLIVCTVSLACKGQLIHAPFGIINKLSRNNDTMHDILKIFALHPIQLCQQVNKHSFMGFEIIGVELAQAGP
jgi:hypothetical protein